MSLTGGNARFVRCSFKEVDLRDWFCFKVEVIDCVFTGRLQGVVFNGTPHPDENGILHRKQNEFRGNDFSGAELIDVAFRTGIDLSKQQLPSGSDYLYLPDAREAFNRARGEVVSWTDVDLRLAVLQSLRSFEWELNGGQEQLLLRPKDYSSYSELRKQRRSRQCSNCSNASATSHNCPFVARPPGCLLSREQRV
jgi:hypothetical protein